ncbi:site-specific integrase [Frigidibacter sp. MR17.14]|uniref:tyrosine-type recombinase/integrase n=1 Tax=Frigidibacter sp. MR17.14 TaxID=3126509 RepID=UPI003012E0CF
MPLKLSKRGAVYYLRGTVAGQHVYESTRLGDKKSAEIYRARREAEIIERAAFGRAATTTFADAALTYMQAGGEARYLGPILEHFGPRFRLADIDNDAVNRAAAALYPTAAPATINRQVVTPISAVVNMAADDGLCQPRRFRRRAEKNVRLRWLTPEEAERLLAAASPRAKVVIAFLLGTGCRVNEALRLQRADLHLDTCEAWVSETKNDEPRMVSFPTRSRRYLVTAQLPEAGAVFRTPKGVPYRLRNEDGQALGGQLKAEFDKASDAAKLPRVTPHELRHTWATWFYAQTKDFGGLMDFGGWKKADMANRYRKIAPSDLAARLAKHGWQFGAKSVQDEAAGSENVNEIRGIG